VLLLRAEGRQISAFFSKLVIFGSVAHVAILGASQSSRTFTISPIPQSRSVTPAAIACRGHGAPRGCPPPAGYARWTGPLLARALADIDVQYVWRFLREHNIDLAARKSWCESNDPAFVAKAADVVGLYVDPPAKAIVLCVDEKPSIQALERAQGYLKLPNGRALTGQSHHYKRHGTTILCSQRSKSPPEGSSRRIPSGAVVSSSSASWTASLPPSRIVSFTSCGIRQSMPSRR
jgi:hypothetical protein